MIFLPLLFHASLSARPQQSLDDLAGRRHGHRVDELDALRPFHLGNAVALQPLADLSERHAVCVARHDEHTRLLAHDLVWHWHDRALQHLRMLVDERLYIGGIDLYGAAIYEILLGPRRPEIRPRTR